MRFISTLWAKLGVLVTAIVAFSALRVHYIRQGSKRQIAKHAEQDKANAEWVAKQAKGGLDTARGDTRSPTERVRSLGGLRDG